MHRSLAALVAAALATAALATVYADGTVKSGPQVGEQVPGPFHPLNVNGAAAGKKNCLYCQNAGNPVAVVFARELTPAVAKLIKQLDEATAKNGDKSMGSYAVFCSDKEGLTRQLEDLAGKEKLQKLVLSIDNSSGPKAYNIAQDADVTVLLYNNEFIVRSNHAYKKGELTDGAITQIVNEVPKAFASK